MRAANIPNPARKVPPAPLGSRWFGSSSADVSHLSPRASYCNNNKARQTASERGVLSSSVVSNPFCYTDHLDLALHSPEQD